MGKRKAPDRDKTREEEQALIQLGISKVLGTDNVDVGMKRFEQLAGTLWYHPTETRLDQLHHQTDAMASIAELQPRDPAERMLIGQMIATNEAAMECFRRAMIPDQSFEYRDMSLKHAEKLSATFTRLLDALNKHRGKGQQKVTVEHVHVAAGGQAIVGNIEASLPMADSNRAKATPPSIEADVRLPSTLGDLKQASRTKTRIKEA